MRRWGFAGACTSGEPLTSVADMHLYCSRSCWFHPTLLCHVVFSVQWEYVVVLAQAVVVVVALFEILHEVGFQKGQHLWKQHSIQDVLAAQQQAISGTSEMAEHQLKLSQLTYSQIPVSLQLD